MRIFTQKIVGMMKHENFFASQGGPIILAQVRNYQIDLFFYHAITKDSNLVYLLFVYIFTKD